MSPDFSQIFGTPLSTTPQPALSPELDSKLDMFNQLEAEKKILSRSEPIQETNPLVSAKK